MKSWGHSRRKLVSVLSSLNCVYGLSHQCRSVYECTVMLQAYYDHRSMFYCVFWEEYIVQYLSTVTGLKFFSFLHFLRSFFFLSLFLFIAAKLLCKYRELIFWFNQPFLLLSGFVQICLLATDANKDKLLNSERVWILCGKMFIVFDWRRGCDFL